MTEIDVGRHYGTMDGIYACYDIVKKYLAKKESNDNA